MVKDKIFLQVGLGSMGKRRIRTLLFHNVPSSNIFGFDLSSDRGKEAERLYNIKVFNDFHEAVERTNPDVYIISTPPHLHAKYFLYAAKNRKHFFVEVATTDDGYQKLMNFLDGSFIAAPSCNFRYYAAMKIIKNLLNENEVGRIEAFTHHMGQYLPDWHPWEDYRKVYFAQPESSACKEMLSFEMEWLQWLLEDRFVDIKGFCGKCSDLDMKTFDTFAASIISRKGILGNIMIDVITRFPFRTLRLLGSEGVIEWEWQKHLIQVFKVSNGKWRKISVPKGKKIKGYKTTTEEMYQEEIGFFLDAINGNTEYPYTFKEDQNNFKLLKKLEEQNYFD